MITTERSETGQARRSEDLLRFGILRVFLSSRWYPGVFQAVSVLVLLLILAFAFLGADRGGRNLATVLTWTLWWPLLPISLVLLGRIWCAMCPLAAIGNGVQKLFPPRYRKVPTVIRQHGIWVMVIAFTALTWFDRVWGITSSPRITGIVLSLMLLFVIVVSVAYQRRVWCRYLCPIGALSGLYAMVSPLALRPRSAVCKSCTGKDCYVGNKNAAGCPLFEFPGNLESNRNCNLCSQCLKACPNSALELRLRTPGSELGGLNRPLVAESALSLIMVALVYIQTIDMTTAWPQYMKWMLESYPFLDYGLAFTGTLAATLALTMGLYLMAANASWRPGQTLMQNFAAYGYTYLPIALAGHLGHNLSHLVSEGLRALQVIMDELRIPLTIVPTVDETMAMGGINWMALAVLSVGIFGSILVLRRTARRQSQSLRQVWPHLMVMCLWSLFYLIVFLLPMNPRHSH